MAVWADIDGALYYNCPIRFIPETVIDWYQRYTYAKTFGIAEPYDEQLPKFLDAISVYESQINKYEEAQARQKRQQPTTDGLGILRQSFRARNQNG